MDKTVKQWHDENARLMKKAANDDFEAFDCLFQRFAPLLMHFFAKWGVNIDLAGDLVQKIFVCLWRQRNNYRPKSSFETYLFSIARNILREEMRKSHKIDRSGLKRQQASDEGKYNGLSQPEVQLYLKELIEALEAAKARLPDEQYKALHIAQNPDIELHSKLEQLGWSKEAYKSRLKRARKRIRKDLTPIFLEDLKHKKRRKRP